MDFELSSSLLGLPKRRRRLFIALISLGVSTYGAYKIFNLPSVALRRQHLSQFLGSFISMSEAISESSEVIGIVSRDLNRFIRSDSDEIPNSLNQIIKIAKSDECFESLSRLVEATMLGFFHSCRKWEFEENFHPTTAFSDRVIDKLFTPAGTGFASVVIGSFARNIVLGFFSNDKIGESCYSEGGLSHFWVDVICSSKCRELIAECVQRFVSTAVEVYLDKTVDVNTYEDIFSALTNPKHEREVKNMLVSICNGAVETLIKTSHQVLTASNINLASSSSKDPLQAISMRLKAQQHHPGQSSTPLQSVNLSGELENGGWFGRVSSSLAVPRNRNLILDVTRRVTFQTVKSFLSFLVLKLKDTLKRSADVIHREAVERGLEVINFIGAKSVVVITICLVLCLHLLTGMRVLLHY